MSDCRALFLWIGIVAGLLAMAALLPLAGCSKADAPTATRPNFAVRAEVSGQSMLPTFGVQETVLLELCPFSALRGNDTVVRWEPITKQYIHHRLESRDATGHWTTRGDNNPGADRGHMTSADFIGRTHKIAP